MFHNHKGIYAITLQNTDLWIIDSCNFQRVSHAKKSLVATSMNKMDISLLNTLLGILKEIMKWLIFKNLAQNYTSGKTIVAYVLHFICLMQQSHIFILLNFKCMIIGMYLTENALCNASHDGPP